MVIGQGCYYDPFFLAQTNVDAIISSKKNKKKNHHWLFLTYKGRSIC